MGQMVKTQKIPVVACGGFLVAGIVSLVVLGVALVRHGEAVSRFTTVDGLAYMPRSDPAPCGLAVPTLFELVRGLERKEGRSVDFGSIEQEREALCSTGMYVFVGDRVTASSGPYTLRDLMANETDPVSDEWFQKSLCDRTAAGAEEAHELFGDMSQRVRRAYAAANAAFTAYSFGRDDAPLATGGCFGRRLDPLQDGACAAAPNLARAASLREHMRLAALDTTAAGRGSSPPVPIMVYRLYVLAVVAGFDQHGNGGACFANKDQLARDALCDAAYKQHPDNTWSGAGQSVSAPPPPPGGPVARAETDAEPSWPAYLELARTSQCTEEVEADVHEQAVVGYEPTVPARPPRHASCADALRFRLHDQRRLFGVPDGTLTHVGGLAPWKGISKQVLYDSLVAPDAYLKPKNSFYGRSLAMYAGYRLVAITITCMLTLSVCCMVISKATVFVGITTLRTIMLLYRQKLSPEERAMIQAGEDALQMDGAMGDTTNVLLEGPKTPLEDAFMVQRGVTATIIVLGATLAALWEMLVDPFRHQSPYYTTRGCGWRHDTQGANS